MKPNILQAPFFAVVGLALVMAGSNSSARAQDRPPGESEGDQVAAREGVKTFNLEITEGSFTGPEGRQRASVKNLVKILCDKNPGLNVVLASGVGDIEVKDLKLRSADVRTFLEAISIATDGAVRPGQIQGERTGSRGTWSLTAGSAARRMDRQVEVFNLSGYLERRPPNQSPNPFGDPSREFGGRTGGSRITTEQSLQEVQDIIRNTVALVRGTPPKEEDAPQFVFHEGARLLVVIGPPDVLDVARKVIAALPGQQPMAYYNGMPATTGPGVPNPSSYGRSNGGVGGTGMPPQGGYGLGGQGGRPPQYMPAPGEGGPPPGEGPNPYRNPNPPRQPQPDRQNPDRLDQPQEPNAPSTTPRPAPDR